MSWAPWLATFGLDAGLALTVGALTSLAWARSFRSAWASMARARSSACLGGGIATVFVAGIADLWARSADAAGVAWRDAAPAVGSMLVASHYGRAWFAGMAALMLLAAIVRFGRVARHRSSANAPFAASLCIAISVCTRSVVSHAAEGGDPTLAVAVDGLHLGLIALWVGVVFVASIVAFEASRHAVDDRREVLRWIAALSRTATLVLVRIVATGSFNTWRATGCALGNLPGSTFGTVLFARLFFVCVAIGPGAYNRFRILPSLFVDLRIAPGTSLPLRRFVTVIRLEAATRAVAL